MQRVVGGGFLHACGPGECTCSRRVQAAADVRACSPATLVIHVCFEHAEYSQSSFCRPVNCRICHSARSGGQANGSNAAARTWRKVASRDATVVGVPSSASIRLSAGGAQQAPTRQYPLSSFSSAMQANRMHVKHRGDLCCLQLRHSGVMFVTSCDRACAPRPCVLTN